MSHTGIERLVLGLSGGLDSTLALLVAVRAFDVLQLTRDGIFAFTMPGFGTSSRTRGNAERLARACGVSLQEIDITAGSLRQFEDIGHDPALQDITYENVQARYRTMILMNKANQLRALVARHRRPVGDRARLEHVQRRPHLALQRERRHPEDAGALPARLGGGAAAVRRRPRHPRGHPQYADLARTASARPTAPRVAQRTEEIIGPYELHDFFLYHFARWESRPGEDPVPRRAGVRRTSTTRPRSASGCASSSRGSSGTSGSAR